MKLGVQIIKIFLHYKWMTRVLDYVVVNSSFIRFFDKGSKLLNILMPVKVILQSYSIAS